MAPIDRRYQNVKELLHGIAHIEIGRKTAWIIACCLLVLMVGTLLAKGLTTKSVGEATALKQEEIKTEEIKEHQHDSIAIVVVDNPVDKAVEIQPQQPDRRKVTDAIKKGKLFISERVAQTGMNEHMDTLTSVMYLRQDLGAVIVSSNSWVEEYIQTLKGQYSPEEISEIESALYHETGIITEKWGKKFKQLKDEYDSQFTP